MFNFWWSAGLLDGLKPQKMKCSFLDYINFWWLDGLVDWLKLYLPPMSSQKNEMLIFGLHSTSDDQPGWSMDLNPVLYHSPAKIMKCSFLDYIQLLMISLAGKWTQTTSATPLQPKNEMLIFGLCSTSDDWHGWLMDSNPICHQSPPKVMKCSFLDYIQLLIISLAGQWTWTTSTTSLLLKEWNTHFWITFKFLWLAGQVDGLKPHLPPVSSQKNEMLHFWITFKLLMINWDGQWIWIMSTTSL